MSLKSLTRNLAAALLAVACSANASAQLATVTFATVQVRTALKPNQVRKPLTRMPGFELTNGAVRVKSATRTGDTAEATAEIRSVFRLERDAQGNWRVAEIRTKPDRWEYIEFIAHALNAPSPITSPNPCVAPDPLFKSSSSIQPSMKRTRCLLGNLLGIDVPSDAIRIQEVAPLEIPLGDRPSASVVAWVRVDALLSNGPKGWQVTELRTGNKNWTNIAEVMRRLDDVKRAQSRTELAAMAKALAKFRKERGSYVVSSSHTTLIDYLSPKYLTVVVRVDPWSQPYLYQGTSDHFTLRSVGADGQENTADDVVLSL